MLFLFLFLLYHRSFFVFLLLPSGVELRESEPSKAEHNETDSNKGLPRKEVPLHNPVDDNRRWDGQDCTNPASIINYC